MRRDLLFTFVALALLLPASGGRNRAIGWRALYHHAAGTGGPGPKNWLHAEIRGAARRIRSSRRHCRCRGPAAGAAPNSARLIGSAATALCAADRPRAAQPADRCRRRARAAGETYQDRAARCAHQAGVYGQAAGDRSSLYRQLHQSVAPLPISSVFFVLRKSPQTSAVPPIILPNRTGIMECSVQGAGRYRAAGSSSSIGFHAQKTDMTLNDADARSDSHDTPGGEQALWEFWRRPYHGGNR